jgi:hypothetical protein
LVIPLIVQVAPELLLLLPLLVDICKPPCGQGTSGRALCVCVCVCVKVSGWVGGLMIEGGEVMVCVCVYIP